MHIQVRLFDLLDGTYTVYLGTTLTNIAAYIIYGTFMILIHVFLIIHVDVFLISCVP